MVSQRLYSSKLFPILNSSPYILIMTGIPFPLLQVMVGCLMNLKQLDWPLRPNLLDNMVTKKIWCWIKGAGSWRWFHFYQHWTRFLGQAASQYHPEHLGLGQNGKSAGNYGEIQQNSSIIIIFFLLYYIFYLSVWFPTAAVHRRLCTAATRFWEWN